jgi:Subtilase family
MGSPVRALLLTALTACLATPAAAAQPPAAASRPSTAAPAATPAAAPAKAGSRSGSRAFVPGRLLVGFAARAGEGGRQAAAAAVDGRVLAGHGRTRVLALDQGADVRAAARRLAARPEVAFAEPDWLRRVDACDPDLCWHLQPDPGADLAAAHDGGATGAGRTVAVVDTGVAAIDDLTGRVVERWRCASTCQLEDPDQPAPLNFDHGTEVASVAAADDDGDGITGAAPEAEVVSYRVDSDSGAIPVSAVNAALQQIAGANLDDGIADVDVVNLSLGGPQWSDAEQDAVDAVLDAGIAVVAAAGNQGNYLPQYPAAYHGVVSVGASTQDGGTASFSSYGKVDVVAPGQDVPVVNPGGEVEHADGTSFATPIVAGTLALTPAGGAPQNSVPRAKLALEATAHAELPDGIADAKPWAHGLIDGDAFVDAHQAGADTLLAIDADDPPGSGDGQLPHPATSFTAAAFKADGSLAANPGNATFGGAAGDTTAAFAEAGGGVFTAAADSAELDAGTRTATATIQGTGTSASATVRVLRDDDQAPGVALSGADDEAWRRVDAVQAGSDDDPADDDVDDVYAIVLAAGDTLDAAIARLAGDQWPPSCTPRAPPTCSASWTGSSPAAAGPASAARRPACTSPPRPAAPTCWTSTPPVARRPRGTTGSPGRCGTGPACRWRSRRQPAAPTATAPGTAAPGPPARSAAGRPPRSSPRAPSCCCSWTAPAPGPGAATTRTSTPSPTGPTRCGSSTCGRAAGRCCAPSGSPWIG